MKKRFLAGFLTIMMIIALVPLSFMIAFADTFSVLYSTESSAEDFDYTISEGKVTINYYLGNKSQVVIPEIIEGCPVVSIGDAAFFCRTDITRVIIPDSVETIGREAFGACIMLTNITIPDSVTSIGNDAFFDCSNLTIITMSSNITTIGQGAFSNCTSLLTIKYNGSESDWNEKSLDNAIPNGVEIEFLGNEIPAEDFEYTISNGEATITGYNGIGGDVVIPEALGGYPVTSIGEGVFIGCNSITSITISKTVRTIGEDIFGCCYDLESINVAENNQNFASIDGVLFNNSLTKLIQVPCKMVGDYVIPAGVTTIGDFAFNGCYDITGITIPNSITTIGVYGISGCNNQAIIYYDGTRTEWTEKGLGEYIDLAVEFLVSDPSDDFQYTVSNGKVTITGYTGNGGDVIVPNTLNGYTVVSIGSYAFEACDEITSIIIPNSVVSIGYMAFEDCDGLTSVKIPESVTNIGEYAFEGCDNLVSVTIPESVEIIGYGAFYRCSNLATLNYNAINATYKSYQYYEYRGCFEYCGKLTTVNIGEDVETIPGYLFYKCKWLTTITIPKNVTSIQNGSFTNCSSLTVINYQGSCSEWNQCGLGVNIPKTIKIVCADGANHEYSGNWTSDEENHWFDCVVCGEVKDIAVHEFDNDIDPVCNICGHQRKLALVFAGANLTLKSDLSVNFAVMNSFFTEGGYTNPKVRFEVEGVETVVSAYKVQENRAVFTLSKLSPKQMGDTITATLIATDASSGKEKEYETRTYSVAQYCYRQLENSTNEKLKTLCVDVLNYGAATQEYTGYKTDSLVNKDLTAEQAALATSERAYEDLVNAQSLTDNKDKTAPWKGGRLVLTGAITVEFSFETADIAGCYVEFSDGEIIGENKLIYSGGRYIASYTGCIPADMQEIVSAVVKNKDGEVISGTIAYSIESYAYSKWNDTNLTLKNLVRKMIAYGDSVAIYAAN